MHTVKRTGHRLWKFGKRLSAAGLIAALILSLAACGSAEKEKASSASAVSGSEKTVTESKSAADDDSVWAAQDKLKSLGAGELTGVLFTRYTEGGAESGTIDDPAEIEEIYLRLCNVRIAGPSDMGVDDDGLRLEVDAGTERMSFDFEGDILVLDDGSRYEVEQLDPLKSYLEGILEESRASEEDADIAVGAAEAGEDADAAGDFLVFASPEMGFSFLYEPRHNAYIGDSGVAMLAIDGDKNRTGLFISVVDAENLPSPDEYFEEEIFNLQQRYLNAMAEQPSQDTLSIEGHELVGIAYAYSMPSGGTVDCTEFIEQRDGKYIFYDTRAPRDATGPELEALGVAMESLQLDADYYGPSDAEKGGLPVDDFEAANMTLSNGDTGQPDAAESDWGRADAEPVGTDVDFKSGFRFDVDSSYLMLSDETATQVYTGGAMDGAYFSVEKVTLTDDIGNTVVNRMNEVKAQLQNRMAVPPEVEMIEVGDRRIAGFTCAYSATDGSKTIESEEYYEEIGGQIYCWYAIYDKGDTVTRAAMEHAMETFTIG